MTTTNRTALAAGFALALALCLLFWPRGRQGDPDTAPPSASARQQPPSALPAPSPDSDTPTATATAPPDSAEKKFDPYEAWDTHKILLEFMVPPGEFRGLSMAEAVARFAQIYAQHGGRNIDFHIEDVGGKAGFPLDFAHGNISFRRLLELAAGLAGYEIEIGDGEVAFRPRPPSPDDDAEFQVEIGGFEAPVGKPDIDHIKAQFAELGFGDVEGISIDPDSGALLFDGSLDQAGRFSAVADFLYHGPPSAQVLIRQHLVTTPDGLPFDVQTFPDKAAFREALATLEKIPGIEMLISPTMLTRAGQAARIDIGREVLVPGTPNADGSPGEPETRLVGTSLPITPILAGIDRIQLSGAAEITSGDDGSDAPQENLQTFATDYTGELFDGNTTTLRAAENDGTTTYSFITVRRVKPDGTLLLPTAAETEK